MDEARRIWVTFRGHLARHSSKKFAMICLSLNDDDDDDETRLAGAVCIEILLSQK